MFNRVTFPGRPELKRLKFIIQQRSKILHSSNLLESGTKTSKFYIGFLYMMSRSMSSRLFSKLISKYLEKELNWFN